MQKTLTIIGTLAALAGIAWFCVGSSSNLSWVKERAAAKWRAQGFEVVDYEGYQWGTGGYGTPYGGADVWFRLRKIPENGITYSGYLKRWGDELHVYGPTAAYGMRP